VQQAVVHMVGRCVVSRCVLGTAHTLTLVIILLIFVWSAVGYMRHMAVRLL
jgi:hypothetical protein